MSIPQPLTAKLLGQYIRKARKTAGLTQVDAAGLCGVSIPFFNSIENGKPTARIDMVLYVCHQLGLNIHVELPEELYDT